MLITNHPHLLKMYPHNSSTYHTYLVSKSFTPNTYINPSKNSIFLPSSNNLSLNPPLSHKPLRSPSGNKLWLKNLMSYYMMGHGTYLHLTLLKMWLGVSRFFILKIYLMVLLIDTKLDWLRKSLTNTFMLTILEHLVYLSNLSPFNKFLALPLAKVGYFEN